MTNVHRNFARHQCRACYRLGNIEAEQKSIQLADLVMRVVVMNIADTK
jgi:hypothetical protein